MRVTSKAELPRTDCGHTNHVTLITQVFFFIYFSSWQFKVHLLWPALSFLGEGNRFRSRFQCHLLQVPDSVLVGYRIKGLVALWGLRMTFHDRTILAIAHDPLLRFKRSPSIPKLESIPSQSNIP